MKKIFTVLIAACLLLLCACSPQQPAVSPSASQNATQPEQSGTATQETTSTPSAQPSESAQPSVVPSESTQPSVESSESAGSAVTATPVVTPTPSATAKPADTPTVVPKPNATPTLAPTATPTLSPTATPTLAPTATPDTDKNVIIDDFSAGLGNVQSKDWTQTNYGIANPLLAATTKNTDTGNGFQVGLPDTTAWCQSFDFTGNKVTSAYAAQKKYFRMWVSNNTDGSLAIGVIICTTDGKVGAYNVSNAILTGANGSAVTFSTADSSGMGQGNPSSVVIPSGFQGWLAFDATKFIQNWSNPLVTNSSLTYKLNIDVRPSGFSAGDFYVFDDICFSDSAYGTTRAWTDPNANAIPKDQQILNGFNAAKNTTPALHAMTDFNPTGSFAGIKAYWFEGMEKNGKKTKVFAYVGFPADASSSNKVPAIVLNHGGGGHAFLQWIKMWNDRGYAAIAIDNTGFFPTKVNAGSTETNGDWAHGIPTSLQEVGYTSAPNNDGMYTSAGRVDAMWMYHAVGQSILASNILRADERVDANKVGITGISWGGVITSITIGYDNRFAFAIPVYGSGYLDESLAWMKDNFGGKETQELWLAQDNFDNVDMPVLWMCWNDDTCFSINSNSKSFLDTYTNNPKTNISIVDKMWHSHGSTWARPECIAFADSIVKNGFMFTQLTSVPTDKNINVDIICDGSATELWAKLYYITEKMTYSKYDKHGYGYADTAMDQVWQTTDLTVYQNNITATVPANAKGYYIEVRTKIGNTYYVTSSPYVELP